AASCWRTVVELDDLNPALAALADRMDALELDLRRSRTDSRLADRGKNPTGCEAQRRVAPGGTEAAETRPFLSVSRTAMARSPCLAGRVDVHHGLPGGSPRRSEWSRRQRPGEGRRRSASSSRTARSRRSSAGTRPHSRRQWPPPSPRPAPREGGARLPACAPRRAVRR